jgi:hypothetical protein
MEISKGVLTSIEKLAGCLPQACQPVCLEGVTLLSIGKVSDPPYSDKGKGQGKGQGEKGKKGKKGRKGKKGKGMIEASTQKIQPLYFGDDIRRRHGQGDLHLGHWRLHQTDPRYSSPERLCQHISVEAPGRKNWRALLDRDHSDIIALAAK